MTTVTWVRTLESASWEPTVTALAGLPAKKMAVLFGDATVGALDENGAQTWWRSAPTGVYPRTKAFFGDPSTGGVVLAGFFHSGTLSWLSSIDPGGTVGKQALLESPDGSLWVQAGFALPDGGVLLGGYVDLNSTPEGNSKVFGLVVALDASWAVTWARAIDPTWEAQLAVRSLAPAIGGGTLVGATYWRDIPAVDWIVMALDDAGAPRWSRRLGYYLYEKASLVGIRAAAGGGSFIAGAFKEGTSRCDTVVVRLDEDGLMLWTKRVEHAGEDVYSGCIDLVGFEVLNGESPVLLLASGKHGADPEETALVQIDGAGTVEAQRRYRNGLPGKAKGLGRWSDGAWSMAFEDSEFTVSESLARVDPLGFLDESCPEGFGIDAHYELRDVAMEVLGGPSLDDLAVVATPSAGQWSDAKLGSWPAQCSAP